MSDPKPPEELGILVGHWSTSGTMIDDGSRFAATDIYEWMPGEHFLLHHVEARMGGAEVRTLEVIGASPDGDGYLTWSFDNAGGTATYRAHLDDRKWSIDGDTEQFRGEISEDGKTLSGRWEQKRAGHWAPWMDIVLRKEA